MLEPGAGVMVAEPVPVPVPRMPDADEFARLGMIIVIDIFLLCDEADPVSEEVAEKFTEFDMAVLVFEVKLAFETETDAVPFTEGLGNDSEILLDAAALLPVPIRETPEELLEIAGLFSPEEGTEATGVTGPAVGPLVNPEEESALE